MAESIVRNRYHPKYFAGDVIHEFEEPFIKYLNVPFKAKRCSNCFKESDNLRKCHECKIARYCNMECQRVDWFTAHSVECRSEVFRNPDMVPKLDPNTVNNMLRLMAFLHLNPEQATKTYKTYNGSLRCFNDLTDHSANISKNLKKGIVKLIEKLERNDHQVFTRREREPAYVFRIFGVLHVNGYDTLDEDEVEVIGGALYIGPTVFGHDCRPNAVKVFDNKYRIQIRCINFISVITPPTISYFGGIHKKADRRQKLKEYYGLTCNCWLCRAEEHINFIDYTTLHLLMSTLDDEKGFGDSKILVAYEITGMMEKLFYKYDERITNVFITVIYKLLLTLMGEESYLATVLKVKEFADDVEKRIRYTYGIEHRNYQHFRKSVTPLLKQLKDVPITFGSVVEKQFNRGDIIQEFEKPFIKFLHVSLKAKRCSNCLKKSDRLRDCEDCKFARYCNAQCQQLDWDTAHSIECRSQLFRNPDKVSKLPPNTVHNIIRLMAFFRLHPNLFREYFMLYNGSFRCFNDLMDHREEIGKTFKKGIEQLGEKLNKLDRGVFSRYPLTIEQLSHFLGLLNVNGFELSNEVQTDKIGSGLYVSTTFFNHSCRPNAIIVFDSMHRIQVRCIQTIPVGTLPKISYLSEIHNRADRQNDLQQRYFFTCECSLCEEEKKGPLVNYQKLDYLVSTLEDKIEFGDLYIAIASEIIEMMERLFYEYDERITTVHFRTLKALVDALMGRNPPRITLQKLKAFAEDVENRLICIYGTEHVFYHYFKAQVKSRVALFH